MITPKDKLLFVNLMASYINSGKSINQIIKIIISKSSDSSIFNICNNIQELIMEGIPVIDVFLSCLSLDSIELSIIVCYGIDNKNGWEIIKQYIENNNNMKNTIIRDMIKLLFVVALSMLSHYILEPTLYILVQDGIFVLTIIASYGIIMTSILKYYKRRIIYFQNLFEELMEYDITVILKMTEDIIQYTPRGITFMGVKNINDFQRKIIESLNILTQQYIDYKKKFTIYFYHIVNNIIVFYTVGIYLYQQYNNFNMI